MVILLLLLLFVLCSACFFLIYIYVVIIRWTYDSMTQYGFVASCTKSTGEVDPSCNDGNFTLIYHDSVNGVFSLILLCFHWATRLAT